MKALNIARWNAAFFFLLWLVAFCVYLLCPTWQLTSEYLFGIVIIRALLERIGVRKPWQDYMAARL